MPLLYFDRIEGRKPSEVQALLDAAHDAVVEAFKVPPRDRFQVVSTHPAHEIVATTRSLAAEPNRPSEWGQGRPCWRSADVVGAQVDERRVVVGVVDLLPQRG